MKRKTVKRLPVRVQLICKLEDLLEWSKRNRVNFDRCLQIAKKS